MSASLVMTGEICGKSGEYKCKQHSSEVYSFDKGDKFTPCRKYSHVTTWVETSFIEKKPQTSIERHSATRTIDVDESKNDRKEKGIKNLTKIPMEKTKTLEVNGELEVSPTSIKASVSVLKKTCYRDKND